MSALHAHWRPFLCRLSPDEDSLMAEVLDATLSALLLATATEPWETWYAESRLVLADLLEERGEVDDASLIRSLEVQRFSYRGQSFWWVHPDDGTGLFHEARHRYSRGWARRWCRRRVLDLFSGLVLACPGHQLADVSPDQVRVAYLITLLFRHSLAGPGQPANPDDRDHLPPHWLSASVGSGR